MKTLNKLILSLAILFGGVSYSFAGIIGNLQIKQSSQGNEFYTSQLNNVAINTSIDLRVSLSSIGGGNYGGSVNLPIGFQLSGFVLIGSLNTCNTNIQTSGNNGFTYSFSSIGNCKVELIGTYIMNSLGDKTINSSYNDGSTIYTLNNVYIIVNDTIPPYGLPIGANTGIQINNGALSTNSKYVSLSLSATDNVAVTDMLISNYSNFTGSNRQSYATSQTNYNLLTGLDINGAKTVYVKFRDSSGNESITYTDTIDYQQGLDYLNFYNTGLTYTNANSVNFSGDCSLDTGAANLDILYSFDNIQRLAGINCDNVAKTWSHTFTGFSFNSDNIIRLRFADKLDLSTSKNLIHDNIGPLGSIVVNNSDTYTSDTNGFVSISLTGTDTNNIDSFQLSGDLQGAYIGRFTYQTQNIIVQLTSGDGSKNISVIYYDLAGNPSTIYSGNVILDTTKPTGGVVINNNSQYTTSSQVLLDLTYFDNFELDTIQISPYSNFSGAVWTGFQSQLNYQLTNIDGTKIIYYKLKDKAGNISDTFSDSIVLDSTNPTTTSSIGTGTYQNTSNVNISLTCDDGVGSGCDKIYYRIGTTNSFTQYTNSFTVSGSNETKTIQYYSLDNAGNIESTKSFQLTFSPSYINVVDSFGGFTNSLSNIFTGTCNNLSGSNAIEYRINNGSWNGGINCVNNLWSGNVLLISNVTNDLDFRFVQNPLTTASIQIIHDSVLPTVVSASVDSLNNGYTTNLSNILSLSGFDSNGIQYVQITGDLQSHILTGFASGIPFVLSTTQGSKTLYISFIDYAGNVSNVLTYQFNLDNIIPSLTISPNGGTFQNSQTIGISMNESGAIYYSFNSNIDLLLSGTIYTGPFTITDSRIVYYQGVDLAGNISTKQSRSFNLFVPSNGGGGGGGGGGGFIIYPPIVKDPNTQSGGTGNVIWTGTNQYELDYIFKRVYDYGNDNQIQIFEKILSKIFDLLKNTHELPYLNTDLDKQRITVYHNIADFFLNIFKYQNTKDKQYQKDAKSYLSKLLKSSDIFLNNFDSMFYRDDGFLYPKNPQLNPIIIKLKKILFLKYNSLVQSQKITTQDFQYIKSTYNNFIYTLVYHKIHKTDQTKAYLTNAVQIILKYYNL